MEVFHFHAHGKTRGSDSVIGLRSVPAEEAQAASRGRRGIARTGLGLKASAVDIIQSVVGKVEGLLFLPHLALHSTHPPSQVYQGPEQLPKRAGMPEFPG